jgi:hypothetical protein
MGRYVSKLNNPFEERNVWISFPNAYTYYSIQEERAHRKKRPFS